LALAGVTATTSDPPGGTIDRDDHGEPTGVVRETALEMVRAAIAEPTEEQIAAALQRAGQAFLASGVTSVAEAGIRDRRELGAYQRLWRANRLPLRTYLMMMLDQTLEPLAQLGICTGFGDAWLRIGPVKLFSDGSIGGRTARMRQPYVDQPENVGLWMMEPADLKAKVLQAHRLGFQLAIHAIGDAAIELVLDAYDEAQAAAPRPDPRHRIEHCSIVDAGLIQRIAATGALPIPGTSFLHAFRDAYIQNLGEPRLRYAYCLASYARHGIVAAASSDAPVVSTSATVGLQTMVTRRDIAGHAVWPEEAVPLTEAIRAYTVHGAYASFEEEIKGSLTPGRLGDVTVFETDLFAVKPEELGQVKVDLTIVDGEVVYARA
jgi:hypothetical protein